MWYLYFMTQNPAEVSLVPSEPATPADTFEVYLRNAEGYPLVGSSNIDRDTDQARRALAEATQDVINSLATAPDEAVLVTKALEAILLRPEAMYYLTLKAANFTRTDRPLSNYSDDGEHLG